MSDAERLRRRFERERAARREAEAIAERITRELYRANLEKEAATRAKSRFLANMSHELRTPLNAIIGISEMLLEEAPSARSGQGDPVPPDERFDALERVLRSSRHLLRLIDEVLDISKVEAGRLDLRPERFDVADMVREAVATTLPLARANGNALGVSCPRDVGAMCADPTRVRQVMLNLLGNACKFTRDGTIGVEVARRPSPSGDWVDLVVRDDGVGIAPEELERIFEDFAQAEPGGARRHDGAGLGLAISRRLCHMMGGEIEVHSTPGQGSAFTVRLPAEPPGVE